MFTYFRKVSVFAFLALGLASSVQAANITFEIIRPSGYFDGTPFGTEQVVYAVYDAATDQQLFSTFALVTPRAGVPDEIKCFYVRAGIYDVTANSVLAGTLSDKSASSCLADVPPPPPTNKKVATPALSVR